MPVYEYACKSCGQHFEVAQSFKDEPLTTCEVCGGPLRKVFGSIGVVLKGSGFYRNDSGSRSKAAKAEAKPESTSDAKGDSKGDIKTETKAETKSETKSEKASESTPKAAESAKSA